MHRIDTPTAQTDKFGTGKNGFTNGDPSTGRRATDLNSDMWDAVQEEICNVIEKANITLDKTQHDQLYKAIVGLITEAVPDALLRKNNLSDLVDAAAARVNLGLKSAAVKDVQTSKDDVTSGRVLINGSAIAVRGIRANSTGGDVIDCNDLPGNSVSFTYPTATNSPGFSSSVLDFSGLGGRYNVQLAASYGDGNRFKFRIRNGDTNIWNPWYEFYHTGNKPTASDVGALPLSGGTLSGQLTIRNAAPIIQLAETDTGKNYFIVLDGNGFRIDENSTAGPSILSYSGGSGRLGTSGQFVPGSYANFDARYVSNIQFGAAASMSGSLIGGSAVINVPAGCVITGLTDSGKDNGIIDNVDYATYKPIQKYINNAWVTISG